MKPLPSSQRYAFWLALVRIATGAMWLAHGIPKYTASAGFMPPNGAMTGFINGALTNTTGWYHTFLASTVVPNIGLFAELVRLGEVLTGVALLLGALTRIGGLAGVLLSLNYILAKGHAFSSDTLQGLDLAILVLSGISLVLPTGRYLGVDGLFGRARHVSAPVRAEFVNEPPLSGPTAPPN